MLEGNLDFTGIVTLVTGGSRGLGKAIAKAFAERGARVAICGRKQENLDQAVQEFQGHGLDVMAFPANVGNSDQVAVLLHELDQRFGKLDVLVNNVGMNILTPAVLEAEEGLWDKIIETNLKGTFLACRQSIKLMRRAERGKIINISSVAARKASRGMGIYCVAKAGVEMLTQVLALELASERINVNAVAPGVIRTRFSQPFWSNEEMLKEIVKRTPLGRIAETEDVVGTVLFLASELSDFITGEVITVDGGSMA